MHENINVNPHRSAAAVVDKPAPRVTRSAPWDTQPYSIKRDGINSINCDDEPVRTPGCIQALADEVRLLSGMDRVMIYKFHADHHGEVFAESRQSHLAPWLGMYYPTSASPKDVAFYHRMGANAYHVKPVRHDQYLLLLGALLHCWLVSVTLQTATLKVD